MDIAEYLKDPGCHPPDELDAFLNGDCHLFAIAASRILGLPIFAYFEKRTLKDLSVADCLVHAFCVTTSDNQKIFDAKGFRDISQLKEEYELSIFQWLAPTTAKYLLTTCEPPEKGNIKLEAEIQEIMNFINFYYLTTQ